MRYQIKEAMDKIVDSTQYDPAKLVITHAIPNEIIIAYTNDHHCKVAFRYSNGELFLCADGRQIQL